MAKSTTRVRSGLVGLLFVLACLSVVLGTVAVWAHQTLLVTDQFVAVTSEVVAEPGVQARAAERIASELVTAADVQGRIAGVMPGDQNFLAAPLTAAAEDFLTKRLTTFFATERAQTAFQTAIRFSHEHLVTLLRNRFAVRRRERDDRDHRPPAGRSRGPPGAAGAGDPAGIRRPPRCLRSGRP